MASPGMDQGALLLKRQLMGKLKPNTAPTPINEDILAGLKLGRATRTFKIGPI